MSDNPAKRPTTSAKPTFFDEINWLSLWQASGNDWSWMLQRERAGIQIPQRSQSASRRQPTGGEILFTTVLVLVAIWLQAGNDLSHNGKQQIVPPSTVSSQRFQSYNLPMNKIR